MIVSIIGTNGLLARSIATYCKMNDYEVCFYGRSAPRDMSFAQYHNVDLSQGQVDYNELSKSDLIIYAAGAGIQSFLKESPEIVFRLNVTVPVQICNQLKELNYTGKFISFGSYFEIGETADQKRFTEEEVLCSQLKAPNNYSISKRMLSRFFSSFTAPYTFMHFLLPTIYGEHESAQRLIPYTLKAIETDSELSFTSGEQIRQYIYIDDLSEIIFKSVTTQLESGLYNISGSEQLTVKEVVNLLFKLKGKQLAESVFGKAERSDTGMKVLLLNGDKLRQKINYIPTTTISKVYGKYKF
jgi:nucleoside-diphosphate-sugar epimerase